MPFTNFDNRHFTTAEEGNVITALNDLQKAVENKLANLSPEERQQYGSVNEQNKLIINKVKDYHESQPEMSSPDVNWDEFHADHRTRGFLQNTINRLQSILDGLNNAKILHDWDNYRASLSDYEYAKYKNGTDASGYEAKTKELKQFFTGGNSSPDL